MPTAYTIRYSIELWTFYRSSFNLRITHPPWPVCSSGFEYSTRYANLKQRYGRLSSTHILRAGDRVFSGVSDGDWPASGIVSPPAIANDMLEAFAATYLKEEDHCDKHPTPFPLPSLRTLRKLLVQLGEFNIECLQENGSTECEASLTLASPRRLIFHEA
jgi:hypothetical protein